MCIRLRAGGGGRESNMHPVLAAVPTLAISAIYCTWNLYRQALLLRQRRLRERVAYMLWVVAHKAA